MTSRGELRRDQDRRRGAHRARGDRHRAPAGVRYRITADDSIELDRQLTDLLMRGAIAFLAVMLLLAVALRNARAVALVMGSAAIAIAGTALGLYLLDIPANMLTLAGLGDGDRRARAERARDRRAAPHLARHAGGPRRCRERG